MATCNNCGKPLILNGGKCVYCGSDPSMGHSASNQGERELSGKISSDNMPKQKVNRQEPLAKDKNRKSGKTIRILLFLVLILEAILVSIIEIRIHVGWGIATIMLVNLMSVGLASEGISMANEGLFEHDKKGWRLYHEYLHFPTKMIGILIGLLVVSRFQSFWTLIINLLLGLIIIIVDTSLEDVLE